MDPVYLTLFPCKVKFQENGSKSDPEPEPGSESTEAFLLGRSKRGFSLNGDDSLWSGKDLWRIDLAKKNIEKKGEGETETERQRDRDRERSERKIFVSSLDQTWTIRTLTRRDKSSDTFFTFRRERV